VNYQILHGKTSLKKIGNGFHILELKSFSTNWKDYILAHLKMRSFCNLKKKNNGRNLFVLTAKKNIENVTKYYIAKLFSYQLTSGSRQYF